MSKVINVFGGPGVGKSTTAAGVFYHLKLNRKSTELVREYAKELVWDEAYVKLEDQLAVTSEQNRRMWQLRKKVDYIVTDSPLLLGIHYMQPDYFPEYFEKMVWEIWNCYDNMNFLIDRQGPYDTNGRYHSEEEAKQLDLEIKEMLDKNNIPYYTVTEGEFAAVSIVNRIIGKDY